METVKGIGLEIAKSVFQAHSVDEGGRIVVRRRLTPSGMLPFLANLLPCLVGIEARKNSHYWARKLMALGHEAKPMPAQYVKLYVKRGKSDAADAKAICEAATRPTMRFVAVKSAEQLSPMMLHRVRLMLSRRASESERRLKRFYDAIEAGVADLDDPALKERIVGLKIIRDRSRVDADRAQAMLERTGGRAITPEMVGQLSQAARERMRLDGGGYRRDHLRARPARRGRRRGLHHGIEKRPAQDLGGRAGRGNRRLSACPVGYRSGGESVRLRPIRTVPGLSGISRE